MREKRKQGGAEKPRERKKKALATDGSRNIINMFAAVGAGGSGVASCSRALAAPGAAGPSQEVSSDRESEAPAAMVGQEGEEEIGGGDSRCVC